MKIENLTLVMDRVRKHLFDFAVEHKVYSSDKPDIKDCFLCPNPNHKETNPSSRILNSKIKGFCQGCLRTFDIFTLNHWLTGAPISGPGFILNNLIPLCGKYEVDFEFGDLTEDDRFKIDSFNANRIASDYIVTQPWSDELKSYVESRGLSVDFCVKNGIGVVPDYNGFEAYLKSFYTTVFLRDASFLRPGLFGPRNVIFTLKDHNGNPVGFIARDLNFEEKHEAWVSRGRVGAPPRKYDSSGETNRVYQKRDLLFGFSSFIDHRTGEEPLFIVEGQFDWAILKANGIHNCVALSGKALTPSHLATFRKHGIKDIVLVLDGDNAGRTGVHELLLGTKDRKGILGEATTVRTSVVVLPDGEDPNSYVRKFGIDSFLSLDQVDSFGWVLNSLYETEDALKICEVMIPFILVEANVLRRDQMITTLAESVGISKSKIEEEVQRQDNQTLLQLETEKKALVEEAYRELLHGTGGDITQVLEATIERVREVDRLISVDPLSVDETLLALDNQEKQEIEMTGSAGFRLGQLKNLEIALNGKCEGTVIAIGGVPNTGKSALMSELSKELCTWNDDVVVLLHTIDDNRMQMIHRLVVQFAIDEAMKIGSPLADSISLNKISNPNYWISEYPAEHRDLLHLRSVGYDCVRQLLKAGRLHIKDMTHGSTVAFLDKMVARASADFKGCRIVGILDNFHKAQDFQNHEERIATKRKSQFLKTNIAQRYDATIFSTFEYRKVETGKRPKNDDLRETASLEYDINYLEHLFSPLKAAQDTGNEDKCFNYHGSRYNKLPIIEGDIGKNKITDAKSRHYYKFFPAQSRYVALTEDEVAAIEEANRMDSARLEGRKVIWKDGKRIEVDMSPIVEQSSLEEIPF